MSINKEIESLLLTRVTWLGLIDFKKFKDNFFFLWERYCVCFLDFFLSNKRNYSKELEMSYYLFFQWGFFLKRIEWRKGYKRFFFSVNLGWWYIYFFFYVCQVYVSNFGAIAQVTFKLWFKKNIFSHACSFCF